MPTLARIGNLKISMFSPDHNPPHFHVMTPDGEALVEISTLSILRGVLKARERESVIAWARDNGDLLIKEWMRLNGK